MSGGTHDTGDGFFPAIGDDFDDGPTEDLRARVKSELEPGERVLWTGRGHPRPLPPIRVFPAFFAAVLCGLSGFALAVLFGIYVFRPMDLEMFLLLCLAPGALGGIAAIGMAGGWARHRYWQRRIAASFYVLTDRRAIVGWERRGDVAFGSWTPDLFNGTRCIEHGDGIGAVYFLHNGVVIDPSWAFEGIREAGRVEALIREVLLGEKVLPGADLGEL
jgi:hypothetical protein